MSISWRRGDIVNREDKTYYRLIIIFMNRLRIAVSIRDTIKICQNLDICLHEEAEKWWINELDELVHAELIAHHNDVKQWCKILKKHFWTSSSQALANLNNMRYEIDNVCTRRSSTVYVTAVVAAAKDCEQDETEFTQILHAWNYLDIILHQFIDESVSETTVAQFMKILWQKQFNWFDCFTQASRNQMMSKQSEYRVFTAVRKYSQ